MSVRHRHWLVAYDVCCPRRLGRVRRYLVKRGLPVQYSVFLVRLSPAGLNELLGGLGRLIDPRRDDVRTYPLAEDRAITSLGRSTLAEAIAGAIVLTDTEVPP